MQRRLRLALFAGTLVLSVSGILRADDLFSINAVDQNNATHLVNVTANTLPDLIKNAVQAEGQFQSFSGTNSVYTLNYAGVPNAAVIKLNDSGSTKTMTLDTIGGVHQTFTGSSRDDLKKQLEDYYKKEGASDLASFQKAIAANSPVSAVDGNPLAATAFSSDNSWRRFGLTGYEPAQGNIKSMTLAQINRTDVADEFRLAAGTASPSGTATDAGATTRKASPTTSPSKDSENDCYIRVDPRIGYVDTFGGGYTGDLSIDLGFRFDDHFALVWTPMDIGYVNLQDTNTVQVGTGLGLPINIINPDKTQPWGLQVTPWATVGAGGSYDLLSAGLYVGYGATAAGSYHFDQTTLVGAAQISSYNGIDSPSFDSYKLSTDLDQQLIKIGARAIEDINKDFFVDAGLSYSRFLANAAVQDWVSPSVGVGYRYGRFLARLGYDGDYATQGSYSIHTGNVTLAWAF